MVVALRIILQKFHSVRATLAVSLQTVCVCVCVCGIKVAIYFDWGFVCVCVCVLCVFGIGGRICRLKFCVCLCGLMVAGYVETNDVHIFISPNTPQGARASSFLMFLDHTQWRNTVGRIPLDEWSARLYIFNLASQPPECKGHFILDDSRSHTMMKHRRMDTSGRVISPSQTLLTDNIQLPQKTDIHAHGGIRTRITSKRTAADPCLRPRGHWDRLLCVV